jgi:hypothetical protein
MPFDFWLCLAIIYSGTDFFFNELEGFLAPTDSLTLTLFNEFNELEDVSHSMGYQNTTSGPQATLRPTSTNELEVFFNELEGYLFW